MPGELPGGFFFYRGLSNIYDMGFGRSCPFLLIAVRERVGSTSSVQCSYIQCISDELCETSPGMMELHTTVIERLTWDSVNPSLLSL